MEKTHKYLKIVGSVIDILWITTVHIKLIKHSKDIEKLFSMYSEIKSKN